MQKTPKLYTAPPRADEHRLFPVVNRDLRSLVATQENAKAAPINLVYVSDYSKMGDHFREKKPIYAAFHSGSISQNVFLHSASASFFMNSRQRQQTKYSEVPTERV